MDMDKLVALCRRRGFLFQSSEIYGGLNGFWDYGPLGVELKRNIKDAWWRDMVTGHNELVKPPVRPSTYEMVGLDCTIIMHPQVWKCSGHYDLFCDMMVDCRQTKKRYRYDQVRGRWAEYRGQQGVRHDDRRERSRRHCSSVRKSCSSCGRKTPSKITWDGDVDVARQGRRSLARCSRPTRTSPARSPSRANST